MTESNEEMIEESAANKLVPASSLSSIYSQFIRLVIQGQIFSAPI